MAPNLAVSTWVFVHDMNLLSPQMAEAAGCNERTMRRVRSNMHVPSTAYVVLHWMVFPMSIYINHARWCNMILANSSQPGHRPFGDNQTATPKSKAWVVQHAYLSVHIPLVPSGSYWQLASHMSSQKLFVVPIVSSWRSGVTMPWLYKATKTLELLDFLI